MRHNILIATDSSGTIAGVGVDSMCLLDDINRTFPNGKYTSISLHNGFCNVYRDGVFWQQFTLVNREIVL